MTVRELIAFLEKIPQDHLVIYSQYSDYTVLDQEDITVQSETSKLRTGCAVPHHNMSGSVRRFNSLREYGDGKLPIPLNAVIFPGN